MIIKFSLNQSYWCSDKDYFEQRLLETRNQIFFLKEILFTRPDKSTFKRKIYVTDSSITNIEIYDDGLRDAIVYFKEKHKEVVKDRQHNPFFLDVKSLEEQNLVIVKNLYYDLTDEFPQFQLINLNDEFMVNPEKEPQLFKKIIFKYVKVYINEYVNAIKEKYRYENNQLCIANEILNVNKNNVISTGQYKLFIIDTTCYICLTDNDTNRLCQ